MLQRIGESHCKAVHRLRDGLLAPPHAFVGVTLCWGVATLCHLVLRRPSFVCKLHGLADAARQVHCSAPSVGNQTFVRMEGAGSHMHRWLRMQSVAGVSSPCSKSASVAIGDQIGMAKARLQWCQMSLASWAQALQQQASSGTCGPGKVEPGVRAGRPVRVVWGRFVGRGAG